MIHGICEVIERDALALWQLSHSHNQDQTRINLNQIRDPQCAKVIQKFNDAEIALAVWDITSDISIPAFRCVIFDQSDDGKYIHNLPAGSGCHPSRQIALLRAITEAAQSRLTRISGTRDDVTQQSFALFREAHELDNQLEIYNKPAKRLFDEILHYEHEALDQDLKCLLQHLSMAGLEQVIVVDLTRTEFEIPVVKVIIPGLEISAQFSDYIPGQRAQQKQA